MTGSQCHGSNEHHVNCAWVGFISISDQIQHLFLWSLEEFASLLTTGFQQIG